MDSKVAAVMQGFLALDRAQQDEFISIINRYLTGDTIAKERIVRESKRNFITKVDLGPTSQNCPCCGR